MRVVIQRVVNASVTVGQELIGRIGQGLLVLVGISEDDTQDDAEWLAQKIVNMRIFNDDDHKMNLNVRDVNGSVLVVSQFTLYASTKKGNRPSFIRSAAPGQAIPLYEYFILCIEKSMERKISTGQFGAMMEITLINDGPVTITIDSRNKE